MNDFALMAVRASETDDQLDRERIERLQADRVVERHGQRPDLELAVHDTLERQSPARVTHLRDTLATAAHGLDLERLDGVQPHAIQIHVELGGDASLGWNEHGQGIAVLQRRLGEAIEGVDLDVPARVALTQRRTRVGACDEAAAHASECEPSHHGRTIPTG